MNKLMTMIISLFVLFLVAGCNKSSETQNPTPNTNTPGTVKTDTQTVDVKVTTDPVIGKILTDGKGMTLYIYTKDSKNETVCYDQCAINWPPLIAKDMFNVDPTLIASNFATVTRKDDSKQVTYEGVPLYYWIKDTKPGDTTGEGIGGVWYVYKIGDDGLKAK